MNKFFFTTLLFLNFQVFGQLTQIPSPLSKYYHSGDDFSWHHEVLNYFSELEKLFPGQVKIEKYGQTYEGRPLVLVYIGTKETISNLSHIQKQHISRESTEKLGIAWLSYNVHGNESCGTEAAMETAYLLLTKNSGLLANTLVIMDPCLNPDGRDRYVNYYKQYHGKHTILNSNSAEHQEEWPGGRLNHYFFDLNRDWAWLTQIESASRIPKYNAWLPHVHVDFHEQGMDEPYYFPPAAEPYHEVITNFQREFQKTIGNNHATYFDKKGWLYFSKEIFDLLYPSYGDTYPTYNGAIGMTYEQGGSGRAGLQVQTMLGDTLTLKERIEHHVTTGISTVEMVSKHNARLLKEFQSYFNKPQSFKYKSYVLDGASPNKEAMLALLSKHGISYIVAEGKINQTVSGYDFFTQKNINYTIKESDVIVNVDPLKGTFLNVLFEPSTKLSDSLTYDITAWSLPYAYGISTVGVDKNISVETVTYESLEEQSSPNCYAYAIPWEKLKTATFLGNLLKQGFKMSYAEKEFSYKGNDFEKGTLLAIRSLNAGINFDQTLVNAANANRIEITALPTGLMDKGIDLGSYYIKPIVNPSVGVVYNDNTSALSVGEVWHFVDQQLDYPVQLVKELNFSNLDGLDVLFVPEGMDVSEHEILKNWIQNGGTCIVIGSAASSFMQEEYGMKINNEESTPSNSSFGNYGNLERSALSESIIGAIYKCDVDQSHPLAFGYDKTYFTLRLASEIYPFQGTIVQKIQDKNGWVAGFAGSNVKTKLNGAATVGIQQMGNGSIVYFFDNPLFRGFWENGKLQVANAIFFISKP